MKKDLTIEEEIVEAYTNEMNIMIQLAKIDDKQTKMATERKAILKNLQLARERTKSIKFY